MTYGKSTETLVFTTYSMKERGEGDRVRVVVQVADGQCSIDINGITTPGPSRLR